PDSRGLVLAVSGVEHATVAESISEQFPSSRVVLPGDTGPIDLLCAGRPQFVGGGSGDTRAVLTQIDLTSEQGQEQFAELVALLRTRGLCVAGLFHTQTTEEGLLATADLLALPTATLERVRAAGGAAGGEDAEALLEDLRVLQKACDDRQVVIEEL